MKMLEACVYRRKETKEVDEDSQRKCKQLKEAHDYSIYMQQIINRRHGQKGYATLLLILNYSFSNYLFIHSCIHLFFISLFIYAFNNHLLSQALN